MVQTNFDLSLSYEIIWASTQQKGPYATAEIVTSAACKDEPVHDLD